MPNFRRFWGGYGQAGRVRRLGVLDEKQKRDFFAGIDMFALPSRSDSFGIVFLEAWANGVPNIGYRAGGILSRRFPHVHLLSGIMGAAGVLIVLVPPLQDGVNSYIFDHVTDPRGGPLAASITLFFLPSFLLGLVSPCAIQLASKRLDRVGEVSGSLFALSTVGSTLGTLVTTFYLIPSFGVRSKAVVPYCLTASMARNVASALRFWLDGG